MTVNKSFLLLALLVYGPMSTPLRAQANSDTAASMETSLRQFLQKWDQGENQEQSKDTRYVADFRDLNGDGKAEAIVYLTGNEWCGSGGCTTLVLAQDAVSWRTVTEISITQLPIFILDTTSHGWRSLGVGVGGGGILVGYDAELSFDGKTYPENPTGPPARRLKKGQRRQVVISSTENAKSLY